MCTVSVVSEHYGGGTGFQVNPQDNGGLVFGPGPADNGGLVFGPGPADNGGLVFGPGIPKDNSQPFPPVVIPWSQAAPVTLPWTPEALADLKEILARLKVLDEKLGLKDCEDPKKAEWMQSIEDRLSKLEK